MADRKITILYPSDIEPYEKEMRLRIVQAILALKIDPEAQSVLDPPKHITHTLGDLGQFECRAWPVRGEYYSSESRIIYRILEDDSIEVIAIALRFKSLCYTIAWSRLHNSAQPVRRFRPSGQSGKRRGLL
jgi:hypothetical protein